MKKKEIVIFTLVFCVAVIVGSVLGSRLLFSGNEINGNAHTENSSSSEEESDNVNSSEGEPAERIEDITELMTSTIEISDKDSSGAETYVLTMPDYKKILEEYDYSVDIETFIIDKVNDRNCPTVSIEIRAAQSEEISLTTPEVKRAIEDEFTKAMNLLLEGEE